MHKVVKSRLSRMSNITYIGELREKVITLLQAMLLSVESMQNLNVHVQIPAPSTII